MFALYEKILAGEEAPWPEQVRLDGPRVDLTPKSALRPFVVLGVAVGAIAFGQWLGMWDVQGGRSRVRKRAGKQDGKGEEEEEEAPPGEGRDRWPWVAKAMKSPTHQMVDTALAIVSPMMSFRVEQDKLRTSGVMLSILDVIASSKYPVKTRCQAAFVISNAVMNGPNQAYLVEHKGLHTMVESARGACGADQMANVLQTALNVSFSGEHVRAVVDSGALPLALQNVRSANQHQLASLSVLVNVADTEVGVAALRDLGAQVLTDVLRASGSEDERVAEKALLLLKSLTGNALQGVGSSGSGGGGGSAAGGVSGDTE